MNEQINALHKVIFDMAYLLYAVKRLHSVSVGVDSSRFGWREEHSYWRGSKLP